MGDVRIMCRVSLRHLDENLKQSICGNILNEVRHDETYRPNKSMAQHAADKYHATWNDNDLAFDFQTEEDMLVFLMRFA